MKRIRQIVKFIVFLPPGLLLYLLSPGFRNVVNAKALTKVGPNDTLASGEIVLAVLTDKDGQTTTIGG